MFKSTSTLPLLIASVLGGVAAAGFLIVSAQRELTRFEADEYAAMERSSTDAAVYIRDFVERRKVLVQAFAKNHAELLNTLVKNPEDEDLDTEIRSYIEDYFPEHFAYIARRSDGEFVPDDLGEFVGQACRTDMHEFALNSEVSRIHGHEGPAVKPDYKPFIHPQAKNYHFDLSAHWTAEDETSGLLMISFRPEALVRILHGHELPHHQLVLLRNDRPELVEATAFGWRETFEREGTLSEAETASIPGRVAVAGTRWDVAYLPSLDYLADTRGRIYRNTALSVGLILAFLGILIFWYVLSEAARKKAAAEKTGLLRQSERDRLSLQTLIDVIPVPIYRRNDQGRTDLINQAYASLLGRAPDDILGRTPQEIYGQDVANWIEETDQELLVSPQNRHVYERQIFPDNGMPARDVVIYKARMVLDGETRPSIVGAAVDVTEEKALRRKLEQLATTDPLTGLANRRRFMEVAEDEVARAKRYGQVLSLLTLDIDHFKSVNDTYGHDMGDEAIKAVSRVIEGELRDGIDLAARVGGEEFSVLLPSTDRCGAMAVAERIRQKIAATEIQHRGEMISVTASLGLSSWAPLDTLHSLDDFLIHADKALYAAKNGGRNQTVCFEEMESLANTKAG